jgi:hypothetical protein
MGYSQKPIKYEVYDIVVVLYSFNTPCLKGRLFESSNSKAKGRVLDARTPSHPAAGVACWV